MKRLYIFLLAIVCVFAVACSSADDKKVDGNTTSNLEQTENRRENENEENKSENGENDTESQGTDDERQSGDDENGGSQSDSDNSENGGGAGEEIQTDDSVTNKNEDNAEQEGEGESGGGEINDNTENNQNNDENNNEETNTTNTDIDNDLQEFTLNKPYELVDEANLFEVGVKVQISYNESDELIAYFFKGDKEDFQKIYEAGLIIKSETCFEMNYSDLGPPKRYELFFNENKMVLREKQG